MQMRLSAQDVRSSEGKGLCTRFGHGGCWAISFSPSKRSVSTQEGKPAAATKLSSTNQMSSFLAHRYVRSSPRRPLTSGWNCCPFSAQHLPLPCRRFLMHQMMVLRRPRGAHREEGCCRHAVRKLGLPGLQSPTGGRTSGGHRIA